jgi:acetolactate synthase-1/3 small subunit
MSHISGLFSRRGFNIEGILCGKIDTGENSRIYLLIEENGKTEQIIKQLNKLYDIYEVVICNNLDNSVFAQLDEQMTALTKKC